MIYVCRIMFRYALQYLTEYVDGQVFLIFMAHQLPFPNDGIRYQDQEQRYLFPAGANRVSSGHHSFFTI